MTFSGFPKGGARFFAQLAATQDRDWFKANKAEYQRLWEAPMKALFDALAEKLARSFPRAGPPKHFRIYRDVRFSKDKSPFKTSIAAVLPLFGGGPTSDTGLYLDLGAKPFAAAGRWMLDGDELARYRKAVDTRGAPFAKDVAKARRLGYELMAHETLKRVPAPWDAAHRRAELLKLKGFALTFPPLTPSLLASPKLVDRVVADTKRIAPLLQWVEAAARGKA